MKEQVVKSSMPDILNLRLAAKDMYRLLGLEWNGVDELVWALNSVTHFRILPVINRKEYKEFYTHHHDMDEGGQIQGARHPMITHFPDCDCDELIDYNVQEIIDRWDDEEWCDEEDSPFQNL